MAALGHPSDVEQEASVARGDASCREIVRRRDDSNHQTAPWETKLQNGKE